MKVCGSCAEVKAITEFHKGSVKSRQEYHPWCKTCKKAYAKYHRAELVKDPVKAEKVRAAERTRAQRDRDTLRSQVIRAYGGACACCDERTPEFLGIDHIDNSGAEDRRKGRRGGMALYRWLRTQGYPRDRFQLMCWNCNLALGFFGCCPHRPEVTREVVRRPRINSV